LVGKGKKIYT